MNRSGQYGFSVIELLLVILIIGIVAAIAIPNLMASRRAANEGNAISTLRTYSSAQATYRTSGSGIYATSAQLGAAGLVDPILGAASPAKSGYSFTISVSSAAPAGSEFCATAFPSSPPPAINRSGDRWFGIGVPGVIVGSTVLGDVVCDAVTGGISGGTPLN